MKLIILSLLTMTLLSCASKEPAKEETIVLDKERIRRSIRENLHEAKACYTKALNKAAKNEKVEGKIVLAWIIDDKGQASNINVKSDTVGKPDMQACMIDLFKRIPFPPAPAGVTAEVTAYPFIFTQDSKKVEMPAEKAP